MKRKKTNANKVGSIISNFCLFVLAFWLSFWTDIVFPTQEMLNLTHILVVGGLFILLKTLVVFQGWVSTIINCVTLNVVLIIGGTFFNPEWQNNPSNQGIKTVGMLFGGWIAIVGIIEFLRAGVKTYS